MESVRKKSGIDRRQFLTATGGGLLAAAIPSGTTFAKAAGGPPASAKSAAGAAKAAGNMRKIPIGVFDPVYEHLSLDAMLDKVSALGLEAMEIGTGGYPNNKHCPVDDLVADPSKAKAWLKKFHDKNIQVAALSCHGNPIHPDAKHALMMPILFARPFNLRS